MPESFWRLCGKMVVSKGIKYNFFRIFRVFFDFSQHRETYFWGVDYKLWKNSKNYGIWENFEISSQKFLENSNKITGKILSNLGKNLRKLKKTHRNLKLLKNQWNLSQFY